MAPTVCMTEVGERLGYLDSTLTYRDRLSEKTRQTLSRRLRRYLKSYCLKFQMGLVMEECQPPSCEPPSLECDHDVDRSPRCDRDSLVTITLRTLALLRRNQILQQRLTLLQQETRAFVTTAAASPPVTSNN